MNQEPLKIHYINIGEMIVPPPDYFGLACAQVGISKTDCMSYRRGELLAKRAEVMRILKEGRSYPRVAKMVGRTHAAVLRTLRSHAATQ